eukprot:CAMPEP_0198263588 /NCGR_PEP_ID=MMETSP1447-20131203/12667_1 /TAXON_ID=420782 /ORGANISM="Chaetoceros dichaeta, Strain CCMP1751" /LENGTH=69 /DNA_ID=CAMNT_0043952253 /DNA_START=1 /DNA_END=207 /DNA_ORIENTATION=+
MKAEDQESDDHHKEQESTISTLDQESDDHHKEQQSTLSTVWTNTLISIRKPILRAILAASGLAARNPKT